MARYRTAVNSALWVQLALVVCYVPQLIMLLVITNRKNHSSHVIVIDAITTILTYFNSTLNPFLYCWKFREVRQAVKQTIRQTLCFPWTQIKFQHPICNIQSVGWSCNPTMLPIVTWSFNADNGGYQRDRLLALSLGLRYRQILTLKCMYIITAIFQIASVLASLFYTSGIPLLYKKIVILSFSAISFTSYTKILRTLTRNQA